MEAGLDHAVHDPRVTGAMMIDAAHEAMYGRMRVHHEQRGCDMTYQPEINLQIQLPECAWEDKPHQLCMAC